MKRSPSLIAIVVVAGFIWPATMLTAAAAEPPPLPIAADLKARTADPAAVVDFAIPENPAAAILNSSIPATKPTTPRDFVAGINSLVDRDGKLQPGVSLGVAPYRLFAGHISRDDYDNKKFLVFLSRLQLSLATNSVTTGTAGATGSGILIGSGLSFVLIDKADPRGDARVDAKFGELVRTAPPLPPNPEADDMGSKFGDEVHEGASRAFRAYLQKWRKEKWNARSLGGGLAWRGNSATSALRDAKDDGWAGWLTYADKVPGSGLLSNGLFVANVQHRARELVEENGTKEKRDTTRAGAQLRYGNADFNAYAEVFYRRVSAGAGKKNDWSAEIGAEYRVYDGTWLNASWIDDATGNGESGVRAGLRFGFGKGPKWSRG